MIRKAAMLALALALAAAGAAAAAPAPAALSVAAAKPPTSNCPSGWLPAVGTLYDSWPQPGSKECVDYSGCKWAGMFASIDNGQPPNNCIPPAQYLNGGNGDMDCRIPESVVKAWHVAATFGPKGKGLAYMLYNKTLSVMVEGTPGVTVTVRVIDKCADRDCSGCCSRNTGGGTWALIDIEKWPASQLLGFDPTAPNFDINNVDTPPNNKQRKGAPKGVMPICYKVLANGTGVL